MAWWTKSGSSDSWYNPYFHKRGAAKRRIGLLVLASTLLVACGVGGAYGATRFLRIHTIEVSEQGSQDASVRERFEVALRHAMQEEHCFGFSCSSWALLSRSRVCAWARTVPIPLEQCEVSYKNGTLSVVLLTRPSSFAVLFQGDVWLLDAEGKALRALTTVERVRRAVESQSDTKGVPWEDTRSITQEEAQRDWPVARTLWSVSDARSACRAQTLTIESTDLVRLRMRCDETPLDFLFTFRQDVEEQLSKLQRFLDEGVVDIHTLTYIDARYHQRLFYQ